MFFFLQAKNLDLKKFPKIPVITIDDNKSDRRSEEVAEASLNLPTMDEVLRSLDRKSEEVAEASLNLPAMDEVLRNLGEWS